MALKDTIESVLFISPRPLSVRRLAAIVEADGTAVDEALRQLVEEYLTRNGGVVIAEHEGDVQMITSPASAEVVQKFLKDETTGELTKPSLEALTIVAYRGPVTRAELEKIRGVNCSIILRHLMMRGLVEAREDKRRLVTYYSVSMDFLHFLGLQRIGDLPDYDRLHSAEVLEQFLAQEEVSSSEV